MDDKKKIAIGAGLIAGGLAAYFLSRRVPPSVYTCPCCGVAKFPTIAELEAHMAICCTDGAPTEFGQIQGQILDKISGARIAEAKVYVDGTFDCYSDWAGGYRTSIIGFGSHVLTVVANDYETADFPITLETTFMEGVDLLLTHLPTNGIGEWTEGVVVQSVDVVPASVYLGDPVVIRVYIQGPYPAEYPLTISGTVHVNGETITQSFTITFRNPTLEFPYTPTAIGTFTAQAQDKSATFTVLQNESGIFYSPYGGIRIPVCTKWKLPEPILMPNETGTGYIMTDELNVGYGVPRDDFSIMPVGAGLFYGGTAEHLEIIKAGSPLSWYPSGVISNYSITQVGRYGISVLAQERGSCPAYWSTKEELAEMMALPILATPPFWTWGKWLDPVDVVRGLHSWNRASPYVPYPWATDSIHGEYSVTIECPYCHTKLLGPKRAIGHSVDYLPLARQMLNHIEVSHPDHPFNEAPW